MQKREHDYAVPLNQTGGWRYHIFKNGALLKTSEPFDSRDLATARGNEEACELDGIWD